MNITIIQTSVDEITVESNFNTILSNIRVVEKTDLIVLPELCFTGYNYENIKIWASKSDLIFNALKNEAQRIGCYIIAGTYGINENDKFYNRSVVICPEGYCQNKYDKIHLFKPLSEDTFFCGGSSLCSFNYNENWKIGLGICYDLRFPELFRIYFENDINLMILPSAWPYSRIEVMKKLAIARAIENQCYFVTCNRSSKNHSEITYGGNSLVISPNGDIVASCGVIDDVCNVNLDLDVVKNTRSILKCKTDRRKDIYDIKY
ncbi:MAG: hypothetical protein JXR48_00355 [Candidatus Delongbacteria bacterium]|nr:hypothetical protein [Candidatus Delongbacteria bacterium]MBN2833395.1 hypothetical protein [Candidatus Delongbacteria bacterium]